MRKHHQKSRLVAKALIASLTAILIQAPAYTQPMPGVGNAQNATQNAVDRQAERAQQRAASTAQNRAEAAQNQAADRVQKQAENQAERVQQQVDRVQVQADRAQQHAADRAAAQVERVQVQAERVQYQMARVETQASDRAQTQVDRVTTQSDRALGRTQGNAEKSAEKNAEKISGQAVQLSAQLPAQASARAHERAGQSAGDQAAAVVESIVNTGNGAAPAGSGLPDATQTSLSQQAAYVEISIEPNIRVIEREWVMMVSEVQREQLQNDSPRLMEFLAQTRDLAVLDSYLLKFSIPPDLDANDAILALVPESMRDLIDRNHVYTLQNGNPAGPSLDSPVTEDIALPLPMDTLCSNPVSVGIIDSAIATSHPAFAHREAIISRRFIDNEVSQPEGHGTAIAGVLVGRGPDLNALLPQATLYSAAVVYSQGEYHQGTTAMHILEALDWLIAQDVGVINMSLTGPANRLLEQGVNAAIRRGKVIVAAAGNHGPHAAPVFPAAYQGVITATAVSSNRSIYRWANQGEHIDFASIGVSVPTARGDGSFGRESGTSMAAPVVSAFVACALSKDTGRSVAQVLEDLREQAVDLGAPGRDPVFGYGLLHPSSFAPERSFASSAL